jgi:hypothetical protein
MSPGSRPSAFRLSVLKPNFQRVSIYSVTKWSQNIPASKGPIERILQPCYRFIIKTRGEEKMKKTSERLKENWGILIGIIAWVAIMVLVFTRRMSLSNRIQAMSVITLVFITWFYAVQTQRLVKEQRATLEEERKRRNAEFGMQRIQKFLRPLLKRLEDLKDIVSLIAKASKNPLQLDFENLRGLFRAQLNGTKEFFGEYLYMTNAVIRYGYLKITHMIMPTSIENPSEEFITQWKKEIDKYIAELETEVNNEISRICQNIRKAYGFFLPKTEISGSSDDLAVLLDRPPKRF